MKPCKDCPTWLTKKLAELAPKPDPTKLHLIACDLLLTRKARTKAA